jgi:hypothetical protein
MTQSSGPDPFEFLKMLWGPMGLPMPGMVTPTLDVSEIEKRIAELKSVETWLAMNLNLLKMTIQGMEMQRATLSTMQSMQAAGAEAAKAGAQAGASGNPFAEAWWNVLQQQVQTLQPKDQKDPANK